MAKYRKKVLVEAVQTPAVEWDRLVTYWPEFGLVKRRFRSGAWLKSLEGWLKVTPGDWVITGVRGERWCCDAGIFAETYEPA